MTSRSSRRRLKETGVPNLEENKNEEETLDDAGLVRRKSLRHSPGSSLSPPYKKCVKENLETCVENLNPIILETEESDDGNGLINELENKNLNISSRKVSKTNSVNIKTSTTFSTPSILMSKKGQYSDSSFPSATTSMQKTINKNNVQIDNEKKIPSNLFDLKSKKRLPSPPTQIQIESKRVKLEELEENFSMNKNSSQIEATTKLLDSEATILELPGAVVESKLSTNSTVKNGECSTKEVEKENETTGHLKRSISSPESIDKLAKKMKSSSLNDISNRNNDAIHDLTVCAQELSKLKMIENSEIVDLDNNLSKLLINDLNLTLEQYQEISPYINEKIKDSNYLVIIEELVKNLLQENVSFKSMTSPRFNKFLRQLLSKYCGTEASVQSKHKLCKNSLAWAKERKLVNLRHDLESTLMTLYFDTGFMREAEQVASDLYKAAKKLQEKEHTVKSCLCLSKVYHAMGNISKARANITTAKTEALKMYAPPDLQAELDLQSGIMQVAEEKDMETAFSYFKEAATGFLTKVQRSRALKYMLLTKLLNNRAEEGEKAVRIQSHVNDIDRGVEAMLRITSASLKSSLADFQKVRVEFSEELENDIVIKSVLDQLYSSMLESNLKNIIKPYERMEISKISKEIGVCRVEVERRISQMILDGQIDAQLDHRDHCLYVYDSQAKDLVYKNAIETISQFDKTISLLNRSVKKLL